MTDITVAQIKDTRHKYGLSQRSFATLLGIGVASIVRYEKGVRPSKANANLIRAAQDPHFMQGCLERDGELIPAAQRRKAQECVYEWISLDQPKTEEPMDEMSRIYEFTLQQEVLNERVANMIATLVRWQVEDELAGKPAGSYEKTASRLAKLKPEILKCEDGDWKHLERIAGYLDCADELVLEEERRWAA